MDHAHTYRASVLIPRTVPGEWYGVKDQAQVPTTGISEVVAAAVDRCQPCTQRAADWLASHDKPRWTIAYLLIVVIDLMGRSGNVYYMSPHLLGCIQATMNGYALDHMRAMPDDAIADAVYESVLLIVLEAALHDRPAHWHMHVHNN